MKKLILSWLMILVPLAAGAQPSPTYNTVTAGHFVGGDLSLTTPLSQANGGTGGVGALPVGSLANIGANTVVGNHSGSSVAPNAMAMPSCPNDALGWVTSTGFVCNTSTTQITTINASQSGTYTVPTWAHQLRIIRIGGGGSGGGGGVEPSGTAVSGGGAGSMGWIDDTGYVPASTFGSSIPYTTGAQALGGAGSVGTGSGTNGQVGGSVAVTLSGTVYTTFGGGGGQGGNTTASASGSAASNIAPGVTASTSQVSGNFGAYIGNAGTFGNGVTPNSNNPAGSPSGGGGPIGGAATGGLGGAGPYNKFGGAGGGGGISTAVVVGAGGVGAFSAFFQTVTNAGGAATGQPGLPSIGFASAPWFGGVGASGGGANTAGIGGAGGSGAAIPGAPGAGGGASTTTGGKGGDAGAPFLEFIATP